MLSHAKNNGYALWSFKKKYNCPRNENKGSRNKAKKRISVVRRPTVFFNWIHFFRGKTFIHTERSNELAEYEKEKKRRQGRKRKSRFLRDPRTRHPPIYIIASSTRAFSPNPPSFAGVHVSRSTAFSRNFVLSEKLKMVHQERAISFQLRQKYRYFFIRELLYLIFITKYRYYKYFVQGLVYACSIQDTWGSRHCERLWLARRIGDRTHPSCVHARLFSRRLRTCRERPGFSFEEWTRITADAADATSRVLSSRSRESVFPH